MRPYTPVRYGEKDQTVRDTFKEAQDAIKGLDWSKSEESARKYVEAVAGLTKGQKEAIKASANLTEKQQKAVDAVIANAKITNGIAKTSLSNSEREVAANALQKLSLQDLTEEKIKAELASQNLTDAQKQEIATAILGAEANETMSFSFKTLKSNVAATFKAMAQNPMVWVSVAILAVKGLIGIVDALTEDYEEAAEKAEEARQAYEEQIRTIESLNGELETTRQRIEELEGMGSLTLVEQEELGRLREQNALLEQQLELEETLAKYKQADAADAAENVLTKDSFTEYAGGDISRNDTFAGWNTRLLRRMGGRYVQDMNILEVVAREQNNANALHKELNELIASMEGVTDRAAIEKFEQKRKELEDAIRELETDIATQMGTIATTAKALYDSNGNVLPGYEELARTIENLNQFIVASGNGVTKELQDRQDALDKFLDRPAIAQNVEAAVQAAKELNGISLEAFTSQFPELAREAEKAGLNVEDVLNSINSKAETVNIDNVIGQMRDAFEKSEFISTVPAQDARMEISRFQSYLGSLTDDEIKVLYGIYTSNDTGAWSIEDWQKAMNDALTGTSAEAENTGKSLQELGESISKLKDLADPLTTAMGEMMSGGGLSSGTAQTIIEKLTEAGLDYVDYLYEENGALKLNTAAWADYIRTVNDANLEGVTDEQARVLQELYATLTEELAGDLYDKAISKLDELHEALDGLSDVDSLDIETYEKLRELMPDLIGDVHDVASAQEALTRAIQRGEQEAEAAYGAMLYANQSWVSGTINSSVSLSNALSSYYGKDVENWKANAASKWEVDSKLVQDLSGLWSKYYGVTTEELTQELKDVETRLNSLSSSLPSSGNNLNNQYFLPNRFPALGLNGAQSATNQLAPYLSPEKRQEQYNELQKQYKELKAVVEMRKNIEDGFKELLNASYSGSGVSSGGSGGSSKKVEEYIADIDMFREAVEALRKAQEEAERLQNAAEEQAGDREKIELQRQLVDAYRSEQIAIQHLNAARSGFISESVDSLRRLGFAVEYNAETNELWIENMEHLNELTAASRGEYDSLQEATNALRQETEDLIETLTDLNEENRDGASTWLELRRQAVDCFLGIVDTAHDAVDQIQDVYDVLHQAADEFAANDGFISIDTLQSVLQLGPQYLQLLKDENGLWEINEERVNAVIAAKSRQLAVENAMTYVEQLKVAAWAGEIDKLNELIFVNDSATSSTWGLVYAELELMRIMGELDDSQYLAALHNIQAMEDLAENAISHIGYETGSAAKNMESMRDQLEKTKDGLQDMLDELEDMRDGAGDLIDYVMDMLKDRVERQIDLLEEAKDKYSEIIDLKKESLDASKDEQDYQKEIAKKLKEMAKLQERINALALDDSRSAQAERAGLLEEMAELQEELADAQAGKAIETQKEALDKMEEDYHAEKDREIEALEESISSTQKLYDMAIQYIKDHWGTLYSELIGWNTEYGSSLNSEITEAWEAACSAAERYGDFVSAVMGGISDDIDRITSQIEELDTRISNLGSGSSLSSSFNTTVSSKGTNSKQTNENMVRTIVGRMKDLGAQWSTLNGAGANNTLHQQAEKLAAQLDQYGVHAEYHPADGTWWITRDELDPNNVGKRLHSCYHTGGFVGREPLKPNEQYIKAENGELMMTARQQDSLVEQINRLETLTKAFQAAAMPAPRISSGGAPSNTAQRVINSVTNNSRPVEVNFGDTIIQGSPNDKTVQQHIKVTRDMMNQIGNLLRRGI